MSRPTEQTRCELCAYSQEHGPDKFTKTTHECRIHPPVARMRWPISMPAHASPDGMPAQVGTGNEPRMRVAQWPTVMRDDWCAAFVPGEPEPRMPHDAGMANVELHPLHPLADWRKPSETE